MRQRFRRSWRNWTGSAGWRPKNCGTQISSGQRAASRQWTVILDVDQSGSMGESVIYSSIMSCTLASMASIRTHIVAFDINVVD